MQVICLPVSYIDGTGVALLANSMHRESDESCH